MKNLSADLTGQVAVLTGGAGVLGMAMAHALAAAGARVALLSRSRAKLEDAASALTAATGQPALALAGDVTDEASLRAALAELQATFGPPTILVNAAGGNRPGATVMPTADLFATDPADWRAVIDLNLMGTVLPSLIFGAAMTGGGSIVNISSMAADRPLTRVGGYSASKAAIDNFTGWLGAELARRYAGRLRVNAIAPGFFIAEQNRHLLLNPDGSPTARGQQVLDQTPMGRFGEPEELAGALLYLVSDAASFVTGTVLRVDGGFSNFAGM
ncbi:SDR family oxidoreductase [Neolewinella lacunae]|uniref:SDR family oxidoreductase n=1 Tax=Neolewinella lacunae TaxID=1517758 RepID=A0A923TE44_9BACT|nr:SDR family oxidoreductase [Neolewinella lacunae]MBC6995517.1 SDR family oxidoreductase [Neolewinella lacunae]MDN3635105.1 SDR family oxidoreductase [Neolewinella lacunae]